MRRRNFITEFPYATTDRPDLRLRRVHQDARQRWRSCPARSRTFEAREQEAATRGKLLGRGISTYVEICGLAPSAVTHAIGLTPGGWETSTVRVHPTGKVTVITGTSPHGQGHATSWSQIVESELGIPFDDVEVIHGDTAFAPYGLGTYGSRSLAVGGTAVYRAAGQVRDKAKAVAAHMLEASPDDLECDAGTFRVKGSPDKSLGIGEVAFRAWQGFDMPEGYDPGLDETVFHDPPNFTFPFGAHGAEVEVDKDTGKVEIVRYIAVDDCGNVVNPMIVDGQVHGGVAQSIGQALYEGAVYNDEGQLLTGDAGGLHHPLGGRDPRDRDASHGDAIARQSDGREGHRRGRHDRCHGGAGQRRLRRGRCSRPRYAAAAGNGVARAE